MGFPLSLICATSDIKDAAVAGLQQEKAPSYCFWSFVRILFKIRYHNRDMGSSQDLSLTCQDRAV